jgi:hypothetical protein
MPKRTSITKQERPQRQRNIHKFLRKSGFWASISGGILALFLSWGVPMILNNVHDGVVITIAGFLFSFPFFFRAIKLYIHGDFKKRTWVIIFASAITVGIILMATQLQFTHPRPKLRVDFDSSSIMASTGEIKFRIVNNGQSAAYQYYVIMFGAPENRLQEVIKANAVFGTSSIEPNEPEYCWATINQATPVTGVWYLYYKLTYSNSPTGGHLYTDDFPYWLSCDFNNPQKGFVELTPAQRDIFEAAIKAYYPDEDFK